eukprot:1160986-Pelagomonas_calceolata.AAC.6
MAKRPAEDAHGPPYKMQETRKTMCASLHNGAAHAYFHQWTQLILGSVTLLLSLLPTLLQIMIPPEYMTKDNKRVSVHTYLSGDCKLVAWDGKFEGSSAILMDYMCFFENNNEEQVNDLL